MIYITADTNYFKITHNDRADYTKFYMNKDFMKLYELQNRRTFEDDISLVITELVFKELQQHKLEAYSVVCRQVETLFHCLGDYGKKEIYITEEQYDGILRRQIENFINENKLLVAPICEKEWFESIVKRAIHKEAPFEGKEKASDKGFKDVLIWYSLLSYAKGNHGKYIFITNDGVFYNNIKELKREFKEITGCDIYFYRNYEQVLQHLVIDDSVKNIDSVSINYDVREIVLKHSNSNYSAKLSYTQPRVFAEEDVLTFINRDIRTIYDDALSHWDSIDLSGCEEGEDNYAGSMMYQVKYNERGILAFLFNGEIYLGGAHGNPYQIGRVYKLSTGTPLGLCELLDKDEGAVLALVKQKWLEDKAKRGNDVYWDDFQPDYKSVEDIKFYLDDKGIHIFFDVYEAACYADGFVEFLLADISEVAF